MQRYFLTFVLISFSYLLQAQPGNPDTDPDVPITGIELLLGVGALFGAKKLFKNSKQK